MAHRALRESLVHAFYLGYDRLTRVLVGEGQQAVGDLGTKVLVFGTGLDDPRRLATAEGDDAGDKT